MQIHPDDAEFTAKPQRNTCRLRPVSQTFFLSFRHPKKTDTADKNVEDVKSCCLFPSSKLLRNSFQALQKALFHTASADHMGDNQITDLLAPDPSASSTSEEFERRQTRAAQFRKA